MREYPAYASLRYPPPVSVRRLQKYVIGPDEAILEYMVTRGRTYLFAIDKTRFHTYSVDYSLNELERDVAAVTRPFYRSDALANWDPSAAYRLYARIVEPVERFFMGKKTVVIIPDGPLSSLPFEVLVTSKSHARKRFWSPTNRPRYLLERYALCYVPSCSVLSFVRTRERKREPGWTLAGFGGALYEDADGKESLNPGAERLLASLSNDRSTGGRAGVLPPLPGARREISEIAKIMGGPVQTYFGTQATETLFKKADLGRYSYIHLATRGVLLGGSGRLWQQPAVVFSLYGDRENDGFLQLGEVFGLELNADLVVLSSCLSPAGAKEGKVDAWQSLSRALLFSGSDSVILSMWPVNDTSAAKLFTEMYRRLKTGSKAEALRLAKLSLLKTEGHGHPYYWAPFVLNGKWQVGVAPTTSAVDLRKLRFKGLSAWRKLLSM
jgi:CHAT domain-containing protein